MARSAGGDGLLFTTVRSPIGVLRLVGDERSLHGVTIDGQRWSTACDPSWRRAEQPFALASRQLEEYFAGDRTRFELPVRLAGTPFQMSVWRALGQIEFASTRSYGQVAASVGRPRAARAVGFANARNPLAIVLPCHRVVGADGRLVGYGGGLERKAWLLEHEASVLERAA